jgi:sulfatase modifying factor 1
MNACSQGGALAYPYGNTYVAGICVDTAYADGAQTLQPVLAATQCEGGFPGLYGMSGNAAEFEDSCTLYTGASDNCEVRGGAYDGTSDLACAGNNLVRRDWAYMDTGFRCCGEVH